MRFHAQVVQADHLRCVLLGVSRVSKTGLFCLTPTSLTVMAVEDRPAGDSDDHASAVLVDTPVVASVPARYVFGTAFVVQSKAADHIYFCVALDSVVQALASVKEHSEVMMRLCKNDGRPSLGIQAKRSLTMDHTASTSQNLDITLIDAETGQRVLDSYRALARPQSTIAMPPLSLIKSTLDMFSELEGPNHSLALTIPGPGKMVMRLLGAAGCTDISVPFQHIARDLLVRQAAENQHPPPHQAAAAAAGSTPLGSWDPLAPAQGRPSFVEIKKLSKAVAGCTVLGFEEVFCGLAHARNVVITCRIKEMTVTFFIPVKDMGDGEAEEEERLILAGTE
jgi:hypothetical protein